MNQPILRELSPSQKTLIGLLAKAVFHADYTPGSETDWTAVLEEAVEQTVFPQVFAAVREELPADLRKTYEKRFFQSVSKNLNVIHAHGELGIFLLEDAAQLNQVGTTAQVRGLGEVAGGEDVA